MIHMCRPRPIQRNQPSRIHRPAKHVLWHKLALVPRYNLLPRVPISSIRSPIHSRSRSRSPTRIRICIVFPLPDVAEPVVVRIVPIAAVLKPLVDQHVRRVVVKRRLDELRHGECGWEKGRVTTLGTRHRRLAFRGVMARGLKA